MIVVPFAIVCVTEPVALGGGGGVVWLLTVAVTVLLASRVPLSLSARTWKVCVPLVTVIDPSAKLSPKGIRSSVSTGLPSTQELDLAGVVLDLVAVRVVDGPPVDQIRDRRPVRDRLRHRTRALGGGGVVEQGDVAADSCATLERLPAPSNASTPTA